MKVMWTLGEPSEGASIRLTTRVERVQTPAGLLGCTPALLARAQDESNAPHKPKRLLSGTR